MSIWYWLQSAENRRHARREVEYNARIRETPGHPAQGRTWDEVLSRMQVTRSLFADKRSSSTRDSSTRS